MVTIRDCGWSATTSAAAVVVSSGGTHNGFVVYDYFTTHQPILYIIYKYVGIFRGAESCL